MADIGDIGYGCEDDLYCLFSLSLVVCITHLYALVEVFDDCALE